MQTHKLQFNLKRALLEAEQKETQTIQYREKNRSKQAKPKNVKENQNYETREAVQILRV